MTSLRAFVVVTALLFPVSAWAQNAEQAIRNQITAFREAFNAANATKIGELYTEDSVILPPGAASIRGREPIQQFWQEALDAGVKNLSLTPVEVVVQNDMAYEMGDFAFDAPAEGGSTSRTTGKYLVIWQRANDGTWRLHRDIWNMNGS